MRRCQCDPRCTRPPLDKEPFCAYHKEHGCPRRNPLTGAEPDYKPSDYNGNDAIQHSHNCYAYMLNVRDKKKIKECGEQNRCKFHVPGKKGAHPEFDGNNGKTCSDLISRTLTDVPGSYLTDFTTKCAPGMSKGFLLVDTDNDIHFGRYDSNGYGSHKPGGRKVTNVDSEGSAIYDASLASWHYEPESKNDTGLHYEFCSHMCIPRDRELTIGGLRSRRTRNKRRPRSLKKAL